MQSTACKYSSTLHLSYISAATLSSPNYPDDYREGLDETYSLEVAADKILQITFEDFEMEDCGCYCDWLKVTPGSLGSLHFQFARTNPVICLGQIQSYLGQFQKYLEQVCSYVEQIESYLWTNSVLHWTNPIRFKENSSHI